MIRTCFRFRNNRKSRHGSAITEAAVGAFVLMPIFLILVDLVGLVIGQTINDEIAKNAARYAAQGTDATSAATLANNYMATCPYIGNGKSIVTAAQINAINWNASQVQVITQVTIDLPIKVPLLNIRQQNMQSQATEPSIGVPAVPPGVVLNGS